LHDSAGRAVRSATQRASAAVIAAIGGLGLLTALAVTPATASASDAAATAVSSPQDCPSTGDPGDAVTDVAERRNWDPLTPSKWAFENDEVALVERGTAPPGPRRPFEYAVLRNGPEFTDLRYEAQVRIDEPVSRNDRDVVLIFNYRSPTRFYYAHLSQDNTIYPHNGIFVVDDADRLRIDDQWNGTTGAEPAIDDVSWHDVRLDYCAESGRIEVYVDDSDAPLMTATDSTFAGGRVAFGSFDNYGRVRDVALVGDAVPGTAPSSDATLATLSLDGHRVPALEPAAPTYQVVVPPRADVPHVTATAADDGATVAVEQAGSTAGTATVTIRAEDRSTRRYDVVFRADRSARTPVSRRARGHCAGEAAELGVAARNHAHGPVDVRVSTGLGTAVFDDVRRGERVWHVFETGGSSLQAGAVRFGVFRDLDAQTAYTQYVTRYPARHCR
jgi:hypothetical protein